MKSGWFWQTPMWEAYQIEYWKGRERPEEYKTSPLADDHDFDGWRECGYIMHGPYHTQVIDLTPPIEALWCGIYKNYWRVITAANESFEIEEQNGITGYKETHILFCGKQVRSDATYECQARWIKDGYGICVGASRSGDPLLAAAAYWIVYGGHAHYMSGPSLERGVMHAVIWHSMRLLKLRGVRLLEMGQIDGATPKEQSIGFFKSHFGGKAVPFTIARRTA